MSKMKYQYIQTSKKNSLSKVTKTEQFTKENFNDLLQIRNVWESLFTLSRVLYKKVSYKDTMFTIFIFSKDTIRGNIKKI